MKRSRFFATLLLMVVIPAVVFLTREKKPWLDESSQAFLTGELAQELASYRSFPVFWWNFLILDSKQPASAKEKMDFERLTEVCSTLAGSQLVKAIPCSKDLSKIKPLLAAWVEDQTLRQPYPGFATAKTRIDSVLAKAALPLGREATEILRLDPFDALTELQKVGREKIKLPFTERDGIFIDEISGRILIPIQFSFPPTDTQSTETFLKALPQELKLLGAHQATYENETSVRRDVAVVSTVGGLLMLVIFATLMIKRRAKILFFIPPLLLSTGAALALTVWFFGQIHGMVLAFGPGVIGLSMDYAIHAAFSTGRTRQTWLANFLGVLTTLTVILTGLFSELPILRQLMFFSGSGLLIGFVAFFFMSSAFPKLFEAETFVRDLKFKKSFALLVSALLLCAGVGALRAKPAFELADLNFETESTAQLGKWLFTEGRLRAPYLMIDTASERSLKDAVMTRRWAEKQKIRSESIASFLPDPLEQETNLSSWQNSICNNPELFSEESKDFFAPFFSNGACSIKTAKLLESVSGAPLYVRDFGTNSSWITLWFPASEIQIKELKSRFPKITSIIDVVEQFPQTLKKELKWIAPLTFFLSTLLLLIYYRSPRLTFAALIPFCAGLGAYFAISFLFPMTLSFITLIGFVMVFGFSLDYGIFATDAEAHDEIHASEVRSALTLTTVMTLAGFLPLLFAHHPAMKHLGQALVFGSIGTYLGALWGVRPWLRLTQRKEKQL